MWAEPKEWAGLCLGLKFSPTLDRIPNKNPLGLCSYYLDLLFWRPQHALSALWLLLLAPCHCDRVGSVSAGLASSFLG